MVENIIDQAAWKEMKLKSENIDKLLEWALEKESIRISHKHSNISNTVKHLKNLMLEFSKKAENLEKSLVQTMRIQEIQFQSEYYQKRISECLRMSESIRTQIEKKNNIVELKEGEANRLKKKLMKLKTQNIRLNMKIENVEELAEIARLRDISEKQREQRRQKKEQDRKMLTCESIAKSCTLKDESKRVEEELFCKIDSARQLRFLVEESFQELREKLKKQESKSNIYGLAGSMLFKLNSNEDFQLPKLKKSESRLHVYDTLKDKYAKHLKNQSKKKEHLKISEQQFLKLSPLQIMGIIELKGGIKQIINKKLVDEEQDQRHQQQETNPVREHSKAKKERKQSKQKDIADFNKMVKV